MPDSAHPVFSADDKTVGICYGTDFTIISPGVFGPLTQSGAGDLNPETSFSQNTHSCERRGGLFFAWADCFAVPTTEEWMKFTEAVWPF